MANHLNIFQKCHLTILAKVKTKSEQLHAYLNPHVPIWKVMKYVKNIVETNALGARDLFKYRFVRISHLTKFMTKILSISCPFGSC